MDELFTLALKVRQRTQVTSLFAGKGYKIAMTDFDDVIFEKAGSLVHVHFDRTSYAESISLLSSKQYTK
ncbi:hypothetical protein [Vibrio salilacus]|uniref:hypothetical protein n=1 Tax=Vibrio salilacus TaxID=1323749 RepID=UPI000C29AA88|nr:hypothetical protein [Vibrio salilacus]